MYRMYFYNEDEVVYVYDYDIDRSLGLHAIIEHFCHLYGDKLSIEFDYYG